MKPLFKGYYASLINHLFQTLLVTYLILLLVEQIWQGIVSTYLNLNYLLVIVIIAGVLDVFSENPLLSKKKPTKIDYIFIIILGILGFAIIKYKTLSLGWLSWLISLIAGVLIILLSILVLEEDESSSSEKLNENKFSTKSINGYKLTWIIILLIIALVIISLLIGIFSNLSILSSFRIIFGSIYVLFLPGLIISFIFFPKDKIDWIERIALSFALSIAIVPLAVFYLNLIGLKITLLNSFLIILGIIIISAGILYIKIFGFKS